MAELAPPHPSQDSPTCLSWTAARLAAHQAGISAMLGDVTRPLPDCDGTTLAADLRAAGDLLAPGGTPVTPAVIGLAAASGHDTLRVRPRPRAAVVVPGAGLLTSGRPAAAASVRDPLGPQLPGWLRRLGATVISPAVTGPAMTGPAGDDPEAYLGALRQARAAGADIIVTTGGTTRGPADELRDMLRELGATGLVDTVRVRPGAPMLLAILEDAAGRGTLLAGLPGHPQSAIAGLLTLVAPVLAGLAGRRLPDLDAIELGAAIPGAGSRTRLAPVTPGQDGCGYPVTRTGPAMLRGLAQAAGFAVIAPGRSAGEGDLVPFVPLPLGAGEHR